MARVVLWALGVNVPKGVSIGRSTVLHHPTAGVVIHASSVIGEGVHIFQNVTIGRADAIAIPWDRTSRVVVEDDVVIGAGAVILSSNGSPVTIGSGARIGANSVVVQDVPAGESWAGVPARRLAAADSADEVA